MTKRQIVDVSAIARCPLVVYTDAGVQKKDTKHWSNPAGNAVSSSPSENILYCFSPFCIISSFWK